MTLLRRRLSSILPQVLGFTNRSFKSLTIPGASVDFSTSSTRSKGIHVFRFPDEVGIVVKLSEYCIASRGGIILGADVFVPENKHVFYSPSEFKINMKTGTSSL